MKLGDSQVTIKMEPPSASLKNSGCHRRRSLTFESPHRLNFKMMLSATNRYVPFRAPEESVDWETMITRMDVMTRCTLRTPSSNDSSAPPGRRRDWLSPYVPPAAPTGMVTQAKITRGNLATI